MERPSYQAVNRVQAPARGHERELTGIQRDGMAATWLTRSIDRQHIVTAVVGSGIGARNANGCLAWLIECENRIDRSHFRQGDTRSANLTQSELRNAIRFAWSIALRFLKLLLAALPWPS